MSRSRRGKKAGEDAERLLQEAFGVSEDQLLKDFILAQTEVKDSDIPPEPEDGFERLMAKLEAEVGTSPESEKESSSENIVKLHEEARKPRRLKSIVKVSVAAAAIAVMVVAMGISAGAKREYRYVVKEKDSKQSDKKLNKLATELRESIGVPSKPNGKQKNKEQFKSSTTAKRNSSIGTINPILHNNSTSTIDKHISLIKPNEREL